jgi:hypothetical protein
MSNRPNNRKHLGSDRQAAVRKLVLKLNEEQGCTCEPRYRTLKKNHVAISHDVDCPIPDMGRQYLVLPKQQHAS